MERCTSLMVIPQPEEQIEIKFTSSLTEEEIRNAIGMPITIMIDYINRINKTISSQDYLDRVTNMLKAFKEKNI